jgi:hypothetical protein
MLPWPAQGFAMLDWKQLVHLSDAELASHDLAEINLACAVDLPGTHKVDVGLCRNRLDYWSGTVRRHTERCLPQYWRKRYAYRNSEAYFRTLNLITVLQRDLGIRYDPAKIPDDASFCPEDTFVHGVIQTQVGTCASLPVVYVAVGRRLGYPLTLVQTLGKAAGHFFARWDDPRGERFNIEASNKGLSTPPDDYYRDGRYLSTPELEKRCCTLKSLTPREELGAFLKQRGDHWKVLGNYRKAVESFAWAHGVAPHNEGLKGCFGLTMNEWHAHLQSLEPPGFPAVNYFWPERRRLPTWVSENMEKDMLILEATENLLKDPDFNRRWWDPLRKGVRPNPIPQKVLVRFVDCGCTVTIDQVHTPVPTPTFGANPCLIQVSAAGLRRIPSDSRQGTRT